MTDYTIWNNTLPSGTSVTSAARNDGIQFFVTGACDLAGIAFYVPATSSGGDLVGSNYTATLYSTTTGTSGTQIAQVTGSGTFTAGAWNWIPFSGVTLSTGVTYVASVHSPGGLQFHSTWWGAGNPGSGGFTSGPLSVPDQVSAVGNKQQPFLAGATAFPSGANSPGTWYGVDVKVSVTSASGAVTAKKMTASGTGLIKSSGVTTIKKMTVDGTGDITGTFSVVFNSVDGNGIKKYDVTSQANGTGSHPMRVLEPTDPDTTYEHSFLYTLPTRPDQDVTDGDPLAIAVAQDYANTYNTTIIWPGYAISPWFADNDGDSTIQQETFTIWVTEWAKAHLATTGTEEHFLIGFSRSGIGGMDLLLRHPKVFSKGAFFDFPATNTFYNAFNNTDATVYGTQNNFANNYELSVANFAAYNWAVPFTGTNRIWMGGAVDFGTELDTFDARLTSLGVLHTYVPDADTTSHSWTTTWITQALSGIFQQHSSGNVSLKKMTVSGIGSASFAGLGATSLKKMTVSGSGNLTIPGTGAVTLKKMTVRGQDRDVVLGTGDVVAKKMIVSGQGSSVLLGAGAVTMKKMIARGSSGKHQESSLFVFSLL